MYRCVCACVCVCVCVCVCPICSCVRSARTSLFFLCFFEYRTSCTVRSKMNKGTKMLETWQRLGFRLERLGFRV